MPQLLVEDVRGLDLLVAARVELLLDCALDLAPEGHPRGEPERHSRRLFGEHEQAELLAELAVVALARLLEALEVLLELLLGREGGAVDPRQHLAALVAAPVGARNRGQLERAD